MSRPHVQKANLKVLAPRGSAYTVGSGRMGSGSWWDGVGGECGGFFEGGDHHTTTVVSTGDP